MAGQTKIGIYFVVVKIRNIGIRFKEIWPVVHKNTTQQFFTALKVNGTEKYVNYITLTLRIYSSKTHTIFMFDRSQYHFFK